jgi:hypothetical protein
MHAPGGGWCGRTPAWSLRSGWTTLRAWFGPGADVRSFHLSVVVVASLASVPGVAWSGGAPAMQVKEMTAKGVESPGVYLNAINRRGPMLATCYGSREALAEAKPFEAFLEVGKDGLPKLVNVSVAGDSLDVELDGCLLTQLNKVRFPEADKKVEVKVVLEPAPPPEDNESADD